MRVNMSVTKPRDVFDNVQTVTFSQFVGNFSFITFAHFASLKAIVQFADLIDELLLFFKYSCRVHTTADYDHNCINEYESNSSLDILLCQQIEKHVTLLAFFLPSRRPNIFLEQNMFNPKPLRAMKTKTQ